MAQLEERLRAAQHRIKEAAFRENKGLGNEVGYYVFDYHPKDELLVREWLTEMQAFNEAAGDGFVLKVFDLYDMIIDKLEDEGFMEQCFRFEKKRGMGRIVKAVSNLFKVNDDDSLIVSHIKAHTPEDGVVFLTGIGKCYPLLRAHKVLNNLHQVLDHVPVVLFYPGQYDGQALCLFSEIKDDNYYRAFRLVD